MESITPMDLCLHQVLHDDGVLCNDFMECRNQCWAAVCKACANNPNIHQWNMMLKYLLCKWELQLLWIWFGIMYCMMTMCFAIISSNAEINIERQFGKYVTAIFTVTSETCYCNMCFCKWEGQFPWWMIQCILWWWCALQLFYRMQQSMLNGSLGNLCQQSLQ